MPTWRVRLSDLLRKGQPAFKPFHPRKAVLFFTGFIMMMIITIIIVTIISFTLYPHLGLLQGKEPTGGEPMQETSQGLSPISLPLTVACSPGWARRRDSDSARSWACTQISGKPKTFPPQGLCFGGKAVGSTAAGTQTIRLANAQVVYLISHGSVAAEGALYRQMWQSYCQGLFHLIAVPHYWQTSIPVHERCRLFYRAPYGSHSCSPEFDLTRYLN